MIHPGTVIFGSEVYLAILGIFDGIRIVDDGDSTDRYAASSIDPGIIMAGGILNLQLCILRIEHFHKAVQERAIPFELVALDGNAALGAWHLEKTAKPLADNLSQRTASLAR